MKAQCYSIVTKICAWTNWKQFKTHVGRTPEHYRKHSG